MEAIPKPESGQGPTPKNPNSTRRAPPNDNVPSTLDREREPEKVYLLDPAVGEAAIRGSKIMPTVTMAREEYRANKFKRGRPRQEDSDKFYLVINPGSPFLPVTPARLKKYLRAYRKGDNTVQKISTHKRRGVMLEHRSPRKNRGEGSR